MFLMSPHFSEGSYTPGYMQGFAFYNTSFGYAPAQYCINKKI